MLYNFDTDSLVHAKAALILYALYKSRDKNSPLNGVETWDRFGAFVRGACLKSHTTAGFVTEFCHKAKIGSVIPKHLSTGDPVEMPETGNLVFADGVVDYRARIIEDNTLMQVFREEYQYLIMLIRERIQREKIEGGIANEFDD